MEESTVLPLLARKLTEPPYLANRAKTSWLLGTFGDSGSLEPDCSRRAEGGYLGLPLQRWEIPPTHRHRSSRGPLRQTMMPQYLTWTTRGWVTMLKHFPINRLEGR